MTAIAAVLALALGLPGTDTAPGRSAQQTQTTPSTAAPATSVAGERDPEAIAALERMGAFLRSLPKFEIDADATTEQVLDNGQMLQFPGTIGIVVQRPNKMRANFYSTNKRREFFYDGKTLTMFSPRMGFYAQVDAPPTIAETVKAMIDRLDLVIPLADLFQMGVDPQLTARIKSATFAGKDIIDDEACNHYAFRQADVDWQIWIRDGDQPLPCRWVVTSIDEPGTPSYEVTLAWDLNPAIPPEAFTFVPPPGADRLPIATVSK